MIFAHRGLVTKNSPENSIASLHAAYKSGFRAIEFDLWFVNEEILIKHDQPSNETLPNLGDYFYFGEEMTYWLDFKNMNEVNAKKIFELVLVEIKKAKIGLDKIFLVPFELNYELTKYFQMLARDVFGDSVQFAAVCEEEKNILLLEEFCAQERVGFLSVFHGLINANFVAKFSRQKIFAWTVNDLKRVAELEKLGVKNFATDLQNFS
ncbi:MAG: glycerophosphodiester phosphodiesterase [Proteobacteria bacterium]|nr:glycerophosphodiester phosphodiesterase [Pseudomonadota bacterium]